MLLDTILSCLADPVKDIKLNFSSLLNNHTLMSEQQFYGTVLASALASRNTYLTIAIRELVVPYLEEKALQAVETAATIMAMNNIYYRFTDLIDDEQYSKIPAGLRMNVMRDHGVDSIDFELWSLAVSVINGCSLCINSHAKQLIKATVSREVIQLTAKIAAVIHALALAVENLKA